MNDNVKYEIELIDSDPDVSMVQALKQVVEYFKREVKYEDRCRVLSYVTEHHCAECDTGRPPLYEGEG